MYRILAIVFNGLIRLLRLLIFGSSPTEDERQRQEDIYSETAERERMRAVSGLSEAYRKRDIHSIGERASEDGVGWEKEEITLFDESGSEIEINHRITHRCDCGVILGYGRETNVLGTCRICGRVVCEKCLGHCERCGIVVCRRHLVRYGDHTFCIHHRLYAWWRLFWGYMK